MTCSFPTQHRRPSVCHLGLAAVVVLPLVAMLMHVRSMRNAGSGQSIAWLAAGSLETVGRPHSMLDARIADRRGHPIQTFQMAAWRGTVAYWSMGDWALARRGGDATTHWEPMRGLVDSREWRVRSICLGAGTAAVNFQGLFDKTLYEHVLIAEAAGVSTLAVKAGEARVASGVPAVVVRGAHNELGSSAADSPWRAYRLPADLLDWDVSSSGGELVYADASGVYLARTPSRVTRLRRSSPVTMVRLDRHSPQVWITESVLGGKMQRLVCVDFHGRRVGPASWAVASTLIPIGTLAATHGSEESRGH